MIIKDTENAAAIMLGIKEVSMECCCLAHCSYLKFYGFKDDEIMIDVCTSNFNHIKRLKKFINQVYLGYEQLTAFCAFISKFARDIQDEAILEIENTFICHAVRGAPTEISLIFYNNKKDEKRNKHSYDIVGTNYQIREFAIELATTFRPQEKEDDRVSE